MPDQKEKATGRVNDQQPDATAHDEMNAAPEHMAPPATDVKREQRPCEVVLSAEQYRADIQRFFLAAELTVRTWAPLAAAAQEQLRRFDDQRAAFESSRGEGVGG